MADTTDPGETRALEKRGTQQASTNPELPLWRLYVYAVASFCLYLPFWVYRAARRQGAGLERSSTPVWWAVGSLIAPVCMALLYRLACNSGVGAEIDSRSRRFALIAPLLLGGLLLLWTLTPLHRLWLLPLLALPIPFLCVQAAINRSAVASRSGGIPAPPAGYLRPGLQLAATAVGVAAFGWASWTLDRTELAGLWSAELVGDSIRGTSSVYELRVPSRSWIRVAPGTYGDANSDLELRGPGTEMWVVAYVSPGARGTIESTVSDRRSTIFDTATPVRFEETRYFLPSTDFLPASFATYSVRLAFGVDAIYVVLTARLEADVVEIIGYSSGNRGFEALRDLVLSFRPSAQPQQT